MWEGGVQAQGAHHHSPGPKLPLDTGRRRAGRRVGIFTMHVLLVNVITFNKFSNYMYFLKTLQK